MKIGVLSDTHGEAAAVECACRILRDQGVQLAIHCGDIGPSIIPLFNGLTTHFVFGNVDNLEEIRQAITDPEHKLHDHFGTLEVGGCQVAFMHGHDIRLLHTTIHSGRYDLVCHGHTHVFSRNYEGRTLVLNPGALSRTIRPSVAIVEIPSLKVTELPL
jgi:putative phosphoesterase